MFRGVKGVSVTEILGKTFLPTATLFIRRLCAFVQKHQTRILAVTAILSPSDSAAMATAIEAILVACALFEKVNKLYEGS